jgi:hypothetical protein
MDLISTDRRRATLVYVDEALVAVFVGEDSEQDASHRGIVLEGAHPTGSAADLAKAALEDVIGAVQEVRHDRAIERWAEVRRLPPASCILRSVMLIS